MGKRTTPTATFLDEWTVELQFPFSQPLVEDLKTKIPASYRSWGPDRKVWTIQAPDPGWAQLVAELLQRAFPYATISERSAHRQRRSVGADDFRVLHLLPSAPPSLVRAARKVLSLEMHPDHGGSHDAMVAINLAYERLEEQGCA